MKTNKKGKKILKNSLDEDEKSEITLESYIVTLNPDDVTEAKVLLGEGAIANKKKALFDRLWKAYGQKVGS